MTDSKSQSPTSSVVNSIVASADEESVEAPAETLAKAAKKEESAKTEDSNDGNEEEKQSPSKAKAVKKDDTNSEKMTSLPAIIADEEGMTIPEAADGSTLYTYRCVLSFRQRFFVAHHSLLIHSHETFPCSMRHSDFAQVPEEELENQPLAAPPPPSSRGAVESSIRVQKFPVKLYAILSQKEFADIVCWMPHGRSWKVLKPNLFESLVMPLFFEYSNYHSFNRLVNAWSFRRISTGPDRGSYYHEVSVF